MAVIRQSLERLTLFDGDLDERDRIAGAFEDFWFFCHQYLPHYFSTKTQAEFHEELKALAMTEEVPGAGGGTARLRKIHDRFFCVRALVHCHRA